MKTKENCPHFGEIQNVQPNGDKCEECDSRSNLRVCMSCGHVGCCESQQAHNTKHAMASNHHVIRSLPLTERSFTWCYVCNDYIS